MAPSRRAMAGSSHSSKTFNDVFSDVQMCIGNLSSTLQSLSEEHEREVSRMHCHSTLEAQPPHLKDAGAVDEEENLEVLEVAKEFVDVAVEKPFVTFDSSDVANILQAGPNPRKPSPPSLAKILEEPGTDSETASVTMDSATGSAAEKGMSVAFSGDSMDLGLPDAAAISSKDRTPNVAHILSQISVDPLTESDTAKRRRRLFFQFASGSKAPRSTSQNSQEVAEAEWAKRNSYTSTTSKCSGESTSTRVRFSGSARLPVKSELSLGSTMPGPDNGSMIFEVLPVWRGDQDVKSLPLLRSRSWKLVDSEFDRLDSMESTEDIEPSFLDKFVSAPGSLQRVLWDLLGMLMIGYDLIFIPLQAFEPRPTVVTDFLSWFTTCYWTLDIPFSFLVGFHTKGIVEMRTVQIAKKYVKGWFAFDVIVVLVDWVMSTVITSGDPQIRRSLRFLRMIRLLRLFKVAGLLNDMMKRIKSEPLLIMLGIVKLIIFIMSVNHLIACGWFWVGEVSDPLFDDTWIKKNDLVDASIGYQYSTALHWSLTQFTPASMEVVPRNTMERTYNVITLIFAMVTFSSFVSSITNAMTRLRNLNSERMDQQSVLRQYLVQNQISSDLTTQIYGFLEKSAEHKTVKRVHQGDVSLLQRLPKNLQDLLQSEVFAPILVVHPFFACFTKVYPKGMHRLYRFALEECSISTGQELFTMGEAADRMHFVVKGMFSYTLGVMGEGYDSCSTVKVGSWLCEQALWIEWRHCGQLVSVKHSEVLDVKATKFQSIVRRELVGVSEPCKYAALFAEYADYLARRKRLTDLCQDLIAIEELADEAWAAAMTTTRNSVENLRKRNSLKGLGHSMMHSFRNKIKDLRLTS